LIEKVLDGGGYTLCLVADKTTAKDGRKFEEIELESE
jgi:hypothetical protein